MSTKKKTLSSLMTSQQHYRHTHKFIHSESSVENECRIIHNYSKCVIILLIQQIDGIIGF